MHTAHDFLKDPAIGLRIARDPHATLSALPTGIRNVFERLYATAVYIKNNPRAPHIPIITELMENLGSGRDAESHYAQLGSAIVEIHEYFADYVKMYLPRNLRQLFTSEGIITNVDDPADLVVGIFFPNAIQGNGSAARISDLSEIRSWIALRTWFCAVKWLPERGILPRGRGSMQKVTAAFEQQVFESSDTDRMRTIHIRYNPHGFIFNDIAHAPGRTTVAMELSSRRLGVKGAPVEAFFESRVKTGRSIWRKASAARRMSDHLASTIVFLNEDDYRRALPMLNRTVFCGAKPKVKDGKRVDDTPNPNAFTYEGVYWSGPVTVGGITSELECSSMRRYFNSMAGLTPFNHLVYEVRRLTRPQSDTLPSIWEILFPGRLYTPLTLELKVQMVKRQLVSVAEDFYPHDSVRARAEIGRVSDLLLAHPKGIDDPLLVKGLVRF